MVLHPKIRSASLLLCLVLLAAHSYGQVNLPSLLEQVERNYPAIAARQERVKAADLQIKLQKNTALPSLDAAYQANYSTYNNITGMFYPATLIPISGPPSSGNVYEAVPGSAASVILKWNPVTFGQRAAAIRHSQKLYEQELLNLEDDILKLKFTAAHYYLEIAATQELIKALDKNLERTTFNLKQVSSLVSAGIRPGVDSVRLKGELSKARTELYSLQNLLASQQHELAALILSDNPEQLATSDLFFTRLPAPAPEGGIEGSLTLKAAQYDVEASEARLDQLRLAWTPKIELWSTAYGRGSGIGYDGSISKEDGLKFTRYNYGAGLQVVFPIVELGNNRLRAQQQEALVAVSHKNLEQTRILLGKEEKQVTNDLATSLLIAREVPAEYDASESAYRALQTRYKTGLVDYAELIQAQYELLNAEVKQKNAYVSSWKNLLRLAVLQGDITIFLRQLEN